MLTVFAGGVGGARFLRGVTATADPQSVTAIVNVGDDLTVAGLRVCPDLDSITYWLSGLVHPEQQWGRADEQFTVSQELRRFGHPDWFTLGDRDLAVHIHRTWRLRDGLALSEVTREITEAFGLHVRLLPATDDPVETRIKTQDGRDLSFQEYWVGHRAEPPVASVELQGASTAQPAPGVLAAILDADAILFAPSNPVVSIGTTLMIPGIRDALLATDAPVVAVSPLIAGKVVRGMADRLLPAVGADVSTPGVVEHYGALVDGWVIDTHDAEHAPAITERGHRVTVTDTLLDDLTTARHVAQACLQMAQQLRGDTERLP